MKTPEEKKTAKSQGGKERCLGGGHRIRMKGFFRETTQKGGKEGGPTSQRYVRGEDTLWFPNSLSGKGKD